MISIIICSVNESDYDELYENIKFTIGDTKYEIIKIDNTEKKYSIFSAYNEGVKRSTGEILVFVHEDVLFKTTNWGKILEHHFENNQNIGIAGVIGSKYLYNYFQTDRKRRPRPWWRQRNIYRQKLSYGCLLQGNRHKDDKPYYTFENGRPINSYETDIVVLDGLILCSTKELFNEIKFDEETFKGFHCYDMDICLQAIAHNKTNIVMGDLYVEHKSCGCVNETFYNELIKFYKKWRNFLPVER